MAICAWRTGQKCNCMPTYEAGVWIARQGKLRRKRFPTLGAAKAWQEDSRGAVRLGKMRASSSTTLEQAAETYLANMRDGTILDRSGERYKPATCRSYERSLRLRILPELGRMKLAQIQRRDVQDLVDDLRVAGLAASTIHNTLDPLRAICRRAMHRDELVVDPTSRLELPAVRGRRDRTASPGEAEALIDALPRSEQALWAAAIYIGARRGELQELRWSDLDLAAGVGRIERAWDDEGRCVVSIKTEAGVRLFPIIAPVKRRLIAHKLATGRDADDLAFGETATRRFVPSTVRRRALKAWGWKQNPERTGPRWVKARGDALEPVTLHEGRHSAATAGSAAG